MAVLIATTQSPMFPLFSDLPAELRNQIWRNALPYPTGPTLHFYKPGCWCPRQLTESDQRWDPNDELNLDLEFRYDLLNHPHIEIPLISVNHESRAIALAWVREQGIETHFRDDSGDENGDNDSRQQQQRLDFFVRPFDLMNDAVYVAPDQWDEFMLSSFNRSSEPDLLDKTVDVRPNMTHLAVPEALLLRRDDGAGGDPFSELFEYYWWVRVLFVVLGDAPEPGLEDRLSENGIKGPPRPGRLWELDESTIHRARALIWDAERGRFEYSVDGDDGEYAVGDRDEALEKRMEEVGSILSKSLITWRDENLDTNFEIRPVVAVAR